MANVLTITCDASKLDAQLSQAEARVKAAKDKMQGGNAAALASGGGMGSRTPKVPDPPIGKWQAFKKTIADVWAEMIFTSGGAKKLVTSLLSGAGAVMVIMQGVQAVGKIIQHFVARGNQATEDARRLNEANLSTIHEIGRMYEEARTKGDSYLNTLSQLAEAEKLNNAQMNSARENIAKLTAAYGDLGIQVDETTGKITGLTSAMMKKAQIDHQRELKNAQAEYSALRTARDQERKNAEEYDTFWQRRYNDGYNRSLDASKRADEIEEKMRRVGDRIRELQKAGDSSASIEAEAGAKNDDRQQTVFDARRRNRATAEDMAADTKAKQLTLYESRLAVSKANQRKLAAAAKGSYDSSTGEHWEDFRSRQIAAEKALEDEKAKGLELEQRVLALRKEVAAEEKEKQRQELGQSADFYKNYLGQVYANTGTVTNSLTARGGFASGARSHDPDRVQREILNCNRQLQRHTEAIARLLGEN